MLSNKRIIAFAFYAIGLIGFPIWMIIQENNTFNEGNAYKFKCAPLDPTDPFRGKYITLRFEPIEFQDSLSNYVGKPTYGHIVVDRNGFANVSSIDTIPPKGSPYLLLREFSVRNKINEYLLPFDRLYMNENKAQAAEDLYRNALRDSTQQVYAKVYISGDRFLLDDVYVDDVPIRLTIP